MDLLSLVIFLPLFGAIALLAFPKRDGVIRAFTVVLTAVVFFLSVKVLVGFESNAEMQFVKHAPWFPSLGVSYKVGIDGLSLWLVMLVTLMMPITVLSAFRAVTKRVKEFHICMLLLETAMIGAFVALDLFLFYVFWEMMLIPMYFLIGMWGGERKIYATVKFFIYTMVGSLLMLVAILFLVYANKQQTGILTFELASLVGVQLTSAQQWLVFLAFAVSFAIKVPMFPFHTWLPDAHVEAPTAASVILAGVLLKMGGYGFLRFAMPMFPEAAMRAFPLMVGLALIGIVYGALVAMVQQDVKKLVAYSSVSHLGFVMLGIFVLNTQAVEGAIYQMLNHGISTGALFLLVGVIYERRHTRMIDDFGGLTKSMPKYAVVFMIVTLSSIGLPLTNGFVGEFLILLGAFAAKPLYGIVAATGVVLGAIYMLWMLQRVFFGPIKHAANEGLKDLTTREMAVFAPIIALIFFMGVYPSPFLSRMEPAVNKFISEIKAAQATLDQDREQRGWIDLGSEENSVGTGAHAVGDVPDKDGADEALERDVADDVDGTDVTESHYDVSSRPRGTGGGAK